MTALKMNFILITVILSVLQGCFCYKLRRDIGKVKYYCNEICRSCGGEGVLKVDLCVCKFEEETDNSRECLNRNRNKLDFLGIKWEEGHESIKKRSVPISNNPGIIVGESFAENSEQNLANKQVFRRSYPFPESDYPSFQWRIVENQDNLREAAPYSKLVLHAENDKSSGMAVKGSDRFRTKSDSTRFAANMFQPVQERPYFKKAKLKLLLAEPSEDLGHQAYYNILEDAKVSGNNQDGIDEENDFDSDYDDESECGDNPLPRLENLQAGTYDSAPSQEEAFDFKTNVNDMIGKEPVWEAVLPKVYSRHSQSLPTDKIRNSLNVK